MFKHLRRGCDRGLPLTTSVLPAPAVPAQASAQRAVSVEAATLRYRLSSEDEQAKAALSPENRAMNLAVAKGLTDFRDAQPAALVEVSR